MPLSPNRSREIALELARPIIEYVDKARHDEGAMLDTDGFTAHASEFFLSEEASRLSRCMMKELHALCLWESFLPCLEHAPEAAVTILAGMIQIHLITHELEERALPPVRLPGSN